MTLTGDVALNSCFVAQQATFFRSSQHATFRLASLNTTHFSFLHPHDSFFDQLHSVRYLAVETTLVVILPFAMSTSTSSTLPNGGDSFGSTKESVKYSEVRSFDLWYGSCADIVQVTGLLASRAP